MAAASKGAAQAGGMVVGLLPGEDRSEANEWVTVALPTGLGELRNGLVVRAADAVIAVGGSYGTLSEIALALSSRATVFGCYTWRSRASTGRDARRGRRGHSSASRCACRSAERCGACLPGA